MHVFQADARWRRVIDLGTMESLWSVGEGLSAGTPAIVTLATQFSLSLLHPSLLQAALPMLEPRVSDQEYDFVQWPFERASVFPAGSHLSVANRLPADFHSQIV